MGQKDRTQRYRESGAGAGLVRVEVLVPRDARSHIVNEARRLREQHRPMPGGAEALPPALVALHDEALTRYPTRCFWNCTPPKTRSGISVVVDQLQRYGDLEAWRLATRITEALESAAG